MASQGQYTEQPREDDDQQGEMVEDTSEQDVVFTIQDVMLIRTPIQAYKHGLNCFQCQHEPAIFSSHPSSSRAPPVYLGVCSRR
jgi:hypothetical protein